MIHRTRATIALVGLFLLAFDRRAAAQENASAAAEESPNVYEAFDQSR